MIILDTNVISEVMKPAPSSHVSAWLAMQPATELITTSITEAEIFLGVELLPRGKRRESLLSDAEAMFTKDLDGRILGFDSDSARLFAKIVAHRRAIGRPINHLDAQIAAITKLRGAKLATRNVDDFSDCGIDLVDPWSS
jgi:predicted nucleic acid-binding protein